MVLINNFENFKIKLHPKTIMYIIDKNNCHICVSHSKTKYGIVQYPAICINYKILTMSRYLYEKVKGKIPKGLILRHKCDNKGCINLDHLILGTKKDNTHDALIRNRLKIEERHPFV